MVAIKISVLINIILFLFFCMTTKNVSAGVTKFSKKSQAE